MIGKSNKKEDAVPKTVLDRPKGGDAKGPAKADEAKAPEPKRTERKLEGAAMVDEATRVAGLWPGRLKDDEGRPGGLIELPEGARPIIIGDLHSNLEYLKAIIDHGTNRADFEAGRASLIIVGDAVHDDRTGHMREMETSVEIMDYILRLIIDHPKNLYYIRGNHDTFDPRLRKSGIAQGIEFHDALVRAHGEEYTNALGRFFEELPVFVIGEGFAITHAGPPRGGLVRDELRNIKRYPEKYHQLMWIRINEFHGNPSPKEYGEKDVRLVLELLDLPPETHFIVGHNPLWTDGNKIGVWLDVIGVKNHHIIYSGSGSKAPYFTLENGKLVVRTAVEPKPEVYVYG